MSGSIVLTDINAGTEIVLSKGSLRKAVAASSAVPGIFPPIEFDGRLLMDGCWVNQLPVDTCRSLGADYAVAVNVGREPEQDFSTDTALDILRRTNAITRTLLNEIQSKDADAIIVPEVGNITWTNSPVLRNACRRDVKLLKNFSKHSIKTMMKTSHHFLKNCSDTLYH